MSRLVHLELHTGDLALASGFYEELLGWQPERVETRSGTYHALGLGGDVHGGVVECGAERALWIPYAEVDCIRSATDRAQDLGARVLLGSREGPSGWRSVVSSPAGGEIALWQSKDRMNELELLAAARGGDEDAFGRLVEPYRRELLAHCYRMLGSVPDAEDALQDALLGAWKGLARFEARSSLRSWLYTIATNACLKAIERRPKRVLPIDYGPPADPHDRPGEPLVESVWVDPFPDAELFVADQAAAPEARYDRRESVELAFIAALQHLPPRQRAVLILRDVLGFSARETAATLDTKPTSVDSALQRAHKTIDARLPDESQQAALGALGDYRPARDRRRLRGCLGAQRHRRGRRHARRGSGPRDAPEPGVVLGPRGGSDLPGRLSVRRGEPLARDPHERQRAAGVRPLHLAGGPRGLHAG